MTWEMISALCAVLVIANGAVGAYLRLYMAREFSKFAHALKEEYVSKEVFNLRIELLESKIEDVKRRVTKP